MQTLKQLGLLFKHMRNSKQGVNSLLTDVDAEAVWAPIQADVNSLQIDTVSFAVGALLQAPVNSLLRQMQTRKQLGLLFMEMGTIKQVGFLYRQM
jgi:hypothetical protein